MTSEEKIQEKINSLEQLLMEREAFWETMAEEPYDNKSENFLIVEIYEGEDHFGEKMWGEVFRYHNRRGADYAALYYEGETVRLTQVKRNFPTLESGTIIREREVIVPDGYDGIQKELKGVRRWNKVNRKLS